MTKHGHLRLPAVLRHRVGLRSGDRVLLVAYPTDDRLVIYPPAALDDLLTGAATHPTGGPT